MRIRESMGESYYVNEISFGVFDIRMVIVLNVVIMMLYFWIVYKVDSKCVVLDMIWYVIFLYIKEFWSIFYFILFWGSFCELCCCFGFILRL